MREKWHFSFFFFTPFATVIVWTVIVCWNFSSHVRWLLILITNRGAKRGWTKKITNMFTKQSRYTFFFYLSNIFYSVTEISSTGLASNGIILVDLKTIKKTQHLELPYFKIEQQLMAYVRISILPSTSHKLRDRVELLTVRFRTYQLSFVFHIMATISTNR